MMRTAQDDSSACPEPAEGPDHATGLRGVFDWPVLSVSKGSAGREVRFMINDNMSVLFYEECAPPIEGIALHGASGVGLLLGRFLLEAGQDLFSFGRLR